MYSLEDTPTQIHMKTRFQPGLMVWQWHDQGYLRLSGAVYRDVRESLELRFLESEELREAKWIYGSGITYICCDTGELCISASGGVFGNHHSYEEFTRLARD